MFGAWIRRFVAENVVKGFNDGVNAITAGTPEDDKPTSVEELRALVARPDAKALSAKADEEDEPTTNGKKKR